MDSFTHQLSQDLSNSSGHGLESASSVDKPGSSGTSFTPRQSDDEVILASTRPKKRAGRRVFKETRHPVFRGVRRRNNDKWVCEMREPNTKTRIWLGTYPTAEMAARAHDVAALALRGKQACLNYADSAWRLPIPVSNDQLDIRRAAAEAAELFRPEEYGGEPCHISGSGDDRDNKEEEEKAEEEEEEEEEVSSSKKTEYLYMDDEDMFDMPMLLSNMAEGLLLSPPRHNMIDSRRFDDDVESGNDFNLWNFSS